jgi:L,D-peptidoglycan transpeptidase YkuD (ErfK/YbiS/YcfS/YnhG family)
MQSDPCPRITVRRIKRFKRLAHSGDTGIPVALGRGGIKANKREGDGGTARQIRQAALVACGQHPRPVTITGATD